jgi:ribokinase
MAKRPKKFDVITVGGATRDMMFYSKEGELVSTGNLTKQKLLAFEYGAKIVADNLYFSFGGGAANTAVSFSKLGLKVAAVCRVGNGDNGRLVVKNFRNNNVDASFVTLDSRGQTGFSVVLTVDNSNKEHVLFGYRGANEFLREKDLPANRANCDWYYVTSLPKLCWAGIMQKLCRSGKNIAWNPGGRQLLQMSRVKKYLPKVRVLILNKDEAYEFKKLKNTKGLLKHLFDLGPEIVVITDGALGAYAYDGCKYYYHKAKKAKSLDTVGVGDAFGSAFVAAVIGGKDVKTALRWGINNSASVISKIGAQNGQLNRRGVNK